jgi:LysM repeat protein
MRQYIKKAYDSVRREVLYSILIEFGVPMKLVKQTNKTNSMV